MGQDASQDPLPVPGAGMPHSGCARFALTGGVAVPHEPRDTDEVSPLELFFDLVFVFAVSQLSDHLRKYLTWRGAAETAVMLIAVFAVWSYTSWGSTLPGVRRASHQWTILSVMVVGLFMNAGISRAFEGHPWLFLAPFLLCRIGPAVWWVITSTQLRDHYIAMLTWFSATALIRVGGTIASPSDLIWWWGSPPSWNWLALGLPTRCPDATTSAPER
jgi:low temperature requirement protein LtrA